jgi:hypothetical protein
MAPLTLPYARHIALLRAQRLLADQQRLQQRADELDVQAQGERAKVAAAANPVVKVRAPKAE